MSERRTNGGFGVVEVIVAVAIVIVAILMVATALPHWREKARAAGCRRNLMHIGMALNLYQNETGGRLPRVDGPSPNGGGPGPLSTMLDELGVYVFMNGEGDLDLAPPIQRGKVEPSRLPWLLCPSEVGSAPAGFPAPTSYRATTGASTDGTGGAFAIGRDLNGAEVEAADGLAYTAAFAERRLGTGRDEPRSNNYARVPGPVDASGCPETARDAWRGDAGSSWAVADWRSTLYNHAIPPGASPSCIADDGRTARMGASSAHADQVHVLLLDGSVRPYNLSVDPTVWRRLADFADSKDLPEGDGRP